eukprot:12915463-Prorocentrum_lima.AAC.1
MGSSYQTEVSGTTGISKVIGLLPVLGPLRGASGIQIISLQSDNGGDFLHGTLITGCQAGGVCMTQIPPYQR